MSHRYGGVRDTAHPGYSIQLKCWWEVDESSMSHRYSIQLKCWWDSVSYLGDPDVKLPFRVGFERVVVCILR